MSKQHIEKIIEEGEKIEENANQILDFTKEVKNMDDAKKIKDYRNIMANNLFK